MQHRAWFAAASVVTFAALPAAGQVTPALSLDAFPAGQFFQSNDQFIIETRRPLTNQPDTEVGVFFWDSAGRARFRRAAADESVIGTLDQPAVGYRVFNFEMNPTKDRLPTALNTIALGGAIPFGPVGPGHLTLIAGAAYAGNSPFNDSEAYYGIGHVLYGIPLQNDNTALILSVDYDGHNAFLPDVPLPGIAFARRGSDSKFGAASYTFGFPYTSITWTPPLFDSRLTFDVRYTFPEHALARVSVALNKNFSAYASYANFLEGFRIHDTPSWSDERMFFQMRRAEVGLRLVAGKLIDISAGVGYAFDQTLSNGFDVRDLRAVWYLRDSPYATFAVRGGF